MTATARIRTLAVTTAVAGALFALPTASRAVDAAKPVPCTGTALIEDKPGDQSVDPTGTGLFPMDAPDNTDIKNVFLNYNPDATGKPVLTANIQVANLSKELPSPLNSQGGVYYYVMFDVGDTTNFVKSVNLDGNTITFQYGTVLQGTYTTTGDTAGKWFEGPDGVVQIDIPESTGAKLGANLAGVMAFVDYIQGSDDMFGLNNHVDLAPDKAVPETASSGVPYTVTECPAATTTPTVTTPGATMVPATLPLKISKVLDGAKKAGKKKALRLSLSTTDTITDLSLSLKKKSGTGATFASAKAASFSGTKTLKLKVLKPKKFKSGTYSLIAKGTVNGAKLKATLVVKVKK